MWHLGIWVPRASTHARARTHTQVSHKFRTSFAQVLHLFRTSFALVLHTGTVPAHRDRGPTSAGSLERDGQSLDKQYGITMCRTSVRLVQDQCETSAKLVRN